MTVPAPKTAATPVLTTVAATAGPSSLERGPALGHQLRRYQPPDTPVSRQSSRAHIRRSLPLPENRVAFDP